MDGFAAITAHFGDRIRCTIAVNADDNIIFCKPACAADCFSTLSTQRLSSRSFSAGRRSTSRRNAGAIIFGAGGRKSIGIQRDFHLQRLTIAQQAQLHFRARFGGGDTRNAVRQAIQRLPLRPIITSPDFTRLRRTLNCKTSLTKAPR